MAAQSFRPPPETCPICGEAVPRKAWACPNCGSDYTTGWSDEAASDGLDLPDQEGDFDYDDFVRNEFGEVNHSPVPKGMKPIWWVTGIVLLVVLAVMWLAFGWMS